MYYLRPDLTVTGYLYRYLSDYIWLKFFSAQMRFPSSNVTIGVRPQHIFPWWVRPWFPLFWGIILWTKTISRHGWKRAAREITVRNAAQKLQVHRYFDNPVASPRSSITDEGEKAGQKWGRDTLPWSASVADDDKIKKREVDNNLPFFTLRTRLWNTNAFTYGFTAFAKRAPANCPSLSRRAVTLARLTRLLRLQADGHRGEKTAPVPDDRQRSHRAGFSRRR